MRGLSILLSSNFSAFYLWPIYRLLVHVLLTFVCISLASHYLLIMLEFDPWRFIYVMWFSPLGLLKVKMALAFFSTTPVWPFRSRPPPFILLSFWMAYIQFWLAKNRLPLTFTFKHLKEIHLRPVFLSQANLSSGSCFASKCSMFLIAGPAEYDLSLAAGAYHPIPIVSPP